MPFTKPSRRRHLRHRVVLQDVVKKNHRVKDANEQSRKKVESKRDTPSVSSGSTIASMNTRQKKKEKETSLVSVLSKLGLQSSKKSSIKSSKKRMPTQQPQASVHIQRFQSFLKWYMPYASNPNWRDAQGCFSAIPESSVALYSFQVVSKESYRLGVTLYDDGQQQQQQRAYIDVHRKTGSIGHKCGDEEVYNHLLLVQRHAQQTAVFRDEASFHRARQGNLVPNLHNVLCILEGSSSWMCS